MLQTQQIQEFKKEILIGKTENSAISIKLEISEDGQFSMSGHEYDLTDALTESEGEQRAREYLEDGELWKMSVQNDNTQVGLDEWIEMVLNVDGWQEILGDIYEVPGTLKYVNLISCGQIDMYIKAKDFIKSEVDLKELQKIFRAWHKLHLKPCNKMPRLSQEVKEVFEKMPEFEIDQLAKYFEDE